MDYLEFKSDMMSIMYMLKSSMQRVIEPMIQKEGLSMIQVYILFGISKGTITNISSLCREFGLNQGNVSNMCKNMEKTGLIKRIRSTEDERIVKLSITEKGSKIIEKLYAESEELNKTLEKIPKEKLDTIINGMHEFNELLKMLNENN